MARRTVFDLGYGDCIGDIDTFCQDCHKIHEVCLRIIEPGSIESQSKFHHPIREITIHGNEALKKLVEQINMKIKEVEDFRDSVNKRK